MWPTRWAVCLESRWSAMKAKENMSRFEGLSNVTINGVHVSSPERDVRNVKLDVIPASLVDSIQVSKTLSANQDGDAIGGSVNLVTKSPDDVAFYSITGL